MKRLYRYGSWIIGLVTSFFIVSVFGVVHAYAVCPVCTVIVIGGVELSRVLGVDDTVSGVWVGGLIVSSGLWTINWLEKKKWRFKLDIPVIMLGYYLIVIWPLHTAGIIGNPRNMIFEFDKLLFGTLIGGMVFAVSVVVHEMLKKKNMNKSYFPFQRVVIPVSTLLVTSLIMYFATKG